MEAVKAVAVASLISAGACAVRVGAEVAGAAALLAAVRVSVAVGRVAGGGRVAGVGSFGVA